MTVDMLKKAAGIVDPGNELVGTGGDFMSLVGFVAKHRDRPQHYRPPGGGRLLRYCRVQRAMRQAAALVLRIAAATTTDSQAARTLLARVQRAPRGWYGRRSLLERPRMKHRRNTDLLSVSHP
jgi:hypothetical protein